MVFVSEFFADEVLMLILAQVVTVFMVMLLYTVVLYSVTAFGLYRKIAQT